MTQAVATLTLPDVPLHRVAPDAFGPIWAWVEKGLGQVRALRKTTPWTADDVLQRLIDGKAALYVRKDGFLILEQCVEPISERRYLNVWVMWAEPQAFKNLQSIIVAWLDAMRLAQGCAWWEFSGARDGWGKVFDGICEEYVTIYRRLK